MSDSSVAESSALTDPTDENVPTLSNDVMARLGNLETRCTELERGWNKTKSILQRVRPGYSKPWRKIGSDEVDKEHEETEVFQISKDLYCVLATASCMSRPFWFALFIIFGFQFTLLFLLATSQIELPIDTDNPLQVPTNVDTQVRVSQALILVIALFSQSDLLSGIEDLVRGRPTSYRGADRFSNMSSLQWAFAAIVRICQGSTNILCAFILSMQSSTVFDVLLNVLGVGFVSDLDDLVFHLGRLGYFGGRMKHLARDIQECDFVREPRQNIREWCFIVWLKKSFHTIVAFVFLIVILYFVVHISLQQDRGEFHAQQIFVELSDEADPFVNALSGCYAAGEFFNNRPVYRQVGAVATNGGVFMYCQDTWGSGRGAWILTTSPNDDLGHACSDSYPNHMTSEITDTFDILEAATGKWYSNTDTKLLVTSVAMKEFDLCKDYLRDVTNYEPARCSVIQGIGSLPLYQVQTEETITNVALTHPVYMSRGNTSANGREVVFFIGRSWVMTTEVQMLEQTSSDWNDFADWNILRDLAWFFRPEQSTWVNFISEPLDPGKVQILPTETWNWYYPTHTGGPFPLVDRSRPVDGGFNCIGCVPDPTGNPCDAGYCNETTRLCECLYNEAGPYCNVPPVGNGVCDDFFNMNESFHEIQYFYTQSPIALAFDGGDCCSSTCSLPHCGKGGLETLFGLALGEQDLEVDATEINTSELVGFQKCRDDQMTAVLLEITPLSSTTEICVPPFVVQCGNGDQIPSTTYLRTPLFCTGALRSLEPERIMAPSGVSCNLTVDNTTVVSSGIDTWRVHLEGGNDTDTTESVLLEASVEFGQVLEWFVPCSNCSNSI